MNIVAGRAAGKVARLRAILAAVEEAVDSGAHENWCDDYWDNDGKCRCWKSDMLAALNGDASE